MFILDANGKLDIKIVDIGSSAQAILVPWGLIGVLGTQRKASKRSKKLLKILAVQREEEDSVVMGKGRL